VHPSQAVTSGQPGAKVKGSHHVFHKRENSLNNSNTHLVFCYTMHIMYVECILLVHLMIHERTLSKFVIKQTLILSALFRKHPITTKESRFLRVTLRRRLQLRNGSHPTLGFKVQIFCPRIECFSLQNQSVLCRKFSALHGG
jgi:hypothetical protein